MVVAGVEQSLLKLCHVARSFQQIQTLDRLWRCTATSIAIEIKARTIDYNLHFFTHASISEADARIRRDRPRDRLWHPDFTSSIDLPDRDRYLILPRCFRPGCNEQLVASFRSACKL